MLPNLIEKMGSLKLFFLLLTVALATADTTAPNQIHLLMPRSGAAGQHVSEHFNCLSWRFAIETDNIKNWNSVPQDCLDYVGNYMLGKQYRDDCDIVAASAYEYAKGLTLAGDGKDIWVFDIDETTLSNLPYYARDDVAFGHIPYNSTKFNLWVLEAVAPAIPASLKLYRKLVKLGFKIVFLTGSREATRQARISNLKGVGYDTFEKLILKGDSETGTSLEYKSKRRTELVEAGYRILGNMGDQWSDLLGNNTGARTFKVPDPMYYIG